MSNASSVSDSDKLQPYLPVAEATTDSWSNDTSVTATCFRGAVQLAFPTTPPGFVHSMVCTCTDCPKVTASMFSSILDIDDAYLQHIRGKEALETFSTTKSIESGKPSINHFCGDCGSLMYRVSERYPGHSLLKLGAVDDFNIVEGRLRPTVKVYDEG